MYEFVLRSKTGHPLQSLGIPGPLGRDLGGGILDLAQILGREFDRKRSEVLL
jgi:hypothetical protein